MIDDSPSGIKLKNFTDSYRTVVESGEEKREGPS